jgi:hypothetical protein
MNQIHIGCAGHFVEMVAIKPDGARRVLSSGFPNLITDNGLELIGNTSGNFLAACRVGSGNTTPVNTDNALVAQVAGTSTNSSVYGGVDVSPRYGYRRITYVFARGAAAGNLTEVGISPVTTGGLLSRALILDGDGNPTTVTVLSDEILSVTYEFRTYLPDDVDSSITISSVSYAIKVRPAGFATTGATRFGGDNTGTRGTWTNLNDGQYGAYFSGDLGTIYLAPAGTTSDVNTAGNPAPSLAAYSAGTHYNDVTFVASENNANFGGGIKSFTFFTSLGKYQMSFTPPVAKDNTKRFTHTMRISWGRHVG